MKWRDYLPHLSKRTDQHEFEWELWRHFPDGQLPDGRTLLGLGHEKYEDLVWELWCEFYDEVYFEGATIIEVPPRIVFQGGWVPTGKQGEPGTRVPHEHLRYDEDGLEHKYVTERGPAVESYSGDLLQEKNPRLRKPMEWEGKRYVCAGWGTGDTHIECYEILPLEEFRGPGVPYIMEHQALKKTKLEVHKGYPHRDRTEKRLDGDYDDDSACCRADPFGFYHGRVAQQGGMTYVMQGRPVYFTSDGSEEVKPKQQQTLF